MQGSAGGWLSQRAAQVRRAVGDGAATYAGFLPGLSYYEGAIPLRPVRARASGHGR